MVCGVISINVGNVLIGGMECNGNIDFGSMFFLKLFFLVGGDLI